MKKFIYFIFLFWFSCNSFQFKPEEQLNKNKRTLGLIEDARNLLKLDDKKTPITQEDKTKIYAALGSSQTELLNSQETISQCIEYKNRAIAQAAAHEKIIKNQGSTIFKLVIIVIILSLWILGPFILRMLAKFTPAGQAIEQLRKEFNSLKAKIKK